MLETILKTHLVRRGWGISSAVWPPAYPLVGFIGLAVDTSRGYVVRAKISNALDAAALASAHSVGTTHFQADVEQYFYANFPKWIHGLPMSRSIRRR